MHDTGVNDPLSVGVTGHRELPDAQAWKWVRGELHEFLDGLDRPLLGVTSLAIGADQIFAEIVLDVGGQIEAIIPFIGYERTFRSEAELEKYEKLRGLCVRVETLACVSTEEEAFLNAGKTVVDR